MDARHPAQEVAAVRLMRPLLALEALAVHRELVAEEADRPLQAELSATVALVLVAKSGSLNMRTIRALSLALWGMVLSPGKLLLERACGSIWFPSLTLR